MLGQPTPEVQAVIADTPARRRSALTRRERAAEIVVGGGFAVAVALIWLLRPPQSVSVAQAIICTLVLVVAMRVRIDTPFGFTVPTQLAFVPLLFAMPLALVPIAAAIAAVCARLDDVVAGRLRPARLVQTVVNAWYAIGPVAVFALARTAPAHAGPALLLAALAMQFIVDFAASGSRFAISRGAGLREQLSDTWVYIVDAALSGVGLVVAEQVPHSPLAAFAPLPVLGLVALFARERHQRLQSLLELNDAYRVARDEALESSRMKSAFLANISHEIRTPMNGVIGMNDLLMSTELDSEQRGYAEQVARSSGHMVAIINDILDIAKIETGELILDIEEFDLWDAVELAALTPEQDARAKGLEFECTVSAAVPRRVRGDGMRMRQVLGALLGNAAKFAHEGSVRGSVTVSEVSPDAIRFEVTDTGIGIDESRIARMFEPFMQADVSLTREYGGNGLGLAIAKDVVERMGGSIGARSEPGVGSTFHVELPLEAAPEPAPAPVRRRDAHMAPRPTAANATRILVVEDSPVNRVVAVSMLERAGFHVHSVNDGREALDALSTTSYDAVLMDCQMPNLDGYEATRELRRRERDGRHTPVIAMTAHAMDADRERCIAAGMDDYLTKPVRAQVLTATLERWTQSAATAPAEPAPVS
ncbi:MAG: response regulator [Solirubrobacteraceae bacterium]